MCILCGAFKKINFQATLQRETIIADRKWTIIRQLYLTLKQVNEAVNDLRFETYNVCNSAFGFNAINLT